MKKDFVVSVSDNTSKLTHPFFLFLHFQFHSELILFVFLLLLHINILLYLSANVSWILYLNEMFNKIMK